MSAASARRLWARLGALDPRLVDGLVAGPLPGGGFRVFARLPVDEPK